MKILSENTEPVCICGGGHQGLSMAAHLALNGVPVKLWNRTEANIRKVMDTKEILCSGVVSGVASVSAASSEMSDMVCDLVMVTTPSSAHRDVARRLAPYVHRNMVIILNPGRTFGAIEFAKELKRCGIHELPHIAETQTIVYTCRRNADNHTTIYALKPDVRIAAISGSDLDYIMSKIPACLKPYFQKERSVGYTSFDNVGMVLHCSPVLMNIGWIESSKADFKYYYDGISPSVAGFIQKIDDERQAVAKAAGFEVESVSDWLKRTYGVQGNDLYECVKNNESYREIDAPPSIACRYILEDVPNGLVPIEYLGRELGVDTPNISTIVNLASSVLNRDFRAEGRQVSLKELMENA